jgi:hypothetical protein
MPNSDLSTQNVYWLLETFWRELQMLGTIVLVLLILMLLGAIPAWPHSRNWGYAPSGGLGLVILVLVILLVMGRI